MYCIFFPFPCPQGYTKSMDMWSVGCILAEMVSNRPLFPGKNYLDQVCKIQEVLGSPSPEDTEFIKNEKARDFLVALPKRPKVTWQRLYPRAHPDLHNLLDRLLTFDPNRRVTVEEALTHTYLKSYYDPSDEPVAETPFTFDMELDDLPTKQLRDMVFKEARDFKRKLIQETDL